MKCDVSVMCALGMFYANVRCEFVLCVINVRRLACGWCGLCVVDACVWKMCVMCVMCV